MRLPSSVAAQEILEHILGYSTPLPVPILRIAHGLGWAVAAQPIADGGGLAYIYRGHVAISVNSELSRPAQRAVVAHEIAHHFLGHRSQAARIIGERALTDFESWIFDKDERQAWQYASELLIPWWAFDADIWDGTAVDLARIFEVPVSLAALRLEL